MTTTTRSTRPTLTTGRRLLSGAALVVLAVFATACDPETGADAGSLAGSPAAAATTADPSASVAPSAAPTSAPASASPSPTDTGTGTDPAAADTTAPAPPPAPAPARTTPKPTPTDPAPGGSCAHHTTGTCGWDVGLTPVSSSEMAECKDGTTSNSASFSGTCSHHGGVRYWFK